MSETSVSPARTLRALVVDDEPAVRKYLHGILKKKFQVEVLEAENGVQGLEAIETTSPDLVVLDLKMPILNGKETLAAIRSDKNFMHLPVIVLTAVKDKATFRELIKLGISDYILKPVDYEFAINRFQIVLAELKNSMPSGTAEQNGAAATNGAQPKLLVIDPDAKFTRFVSDVMGSRFKVVAAASGAAGLTEFARHRPQITLIGEKLPLLNEKLLAHKIRSISESNHKLIMLSDSRRDTAEASVEFDGVLQKSFVADAFTKHFDKATSGKLSPAHGIREIVADYMPSETLNSVKQAFDILAGVQVNAVSDAGVLDSPIRFAAAGLQDERQKSGVRITLACAEADAGRLAAAVHGTSSSDAAQQDQTLQDMVKTISGRLCKTFELHGAPLHEKEEKPVTGTAGALPGKRDLELYFRAESGELFCISMEIC